MADLYGYVGNDPVNWRDPEGNQVLEIAAIGVGVGLVGVVLYPMLEKAYEAGLNQPNYTPPDISNEGGYLNYRNAVQCANTRAAMSAVASNASTMADSPIASLMNTLNLWLVPSVDVTGVAQPVSSKK